jgi:predicted DNA-binding WGR domain protein
VVEWLQGVSSEVKVGRLVLEGAPTPGEVSFWLEERQAMLGGMPIEVRGFELTDQEVARLGALRLDLPLPDVAVRRGLDARSPLQDRVRRFEKVGKSGARFWSVVRAGLEVVVRHGRVGSEGREQRSAYRTEQLAAGEYRRRVRRKVAGGWVEV